jgi:hypothetical protein
MRVFVQNVRECVGKESETKAKKTATYLYVAVSPELFRNPRCNQVAKFQSFCNVGSPQMNVPLMHLERSVHGRQHRCFRWDSLSRPSRFRAVPYIVNEWSSGRRA